MKYKTKEASGLDKAVAELSGDLATVTDELTAVISALDKLKEMCVAKAEPYAERKAREVLGEQGPRVGTVLHPSPASPLANRGWAPQVERQLQELGLDLET